MPLTLIDKTPGDPLRSQDWNAHVHETQRLDQDKVDRKGDTITGALTINGALTAAATVTIAGALTVAANATINGALTAVGNVGIGAGAPDQNLTIQGGPSAYLNLKTAGNAQQLLIGADSGGGLISTMTNHDLQLRAGGNVTRMIVTAGGNVGIGTTTPNFPLHFPNVLGDKIALWGTDPNSHYGFGVQNSTLQIYGDVVGTRVAFGWGSSNNFHEAMRIQGDGTLVVQGAITPQWGNSAARGIMFPTDPGGGGGDSAYMRYYPRTGEACTLEIGIANDGDDHIALISSGNVGVGTINPQTKLHIQSNGGMLTLEGASGGHAYMQFYPLGLGAGRKGYFGFPGNGSNQLFINNESGGTGGAVYVFPNLVQPSDVRLKTNIAPLDDPLNTIRALRGVTYAWKRDATGASEQPPRQCIGFIAQEVAEVLPDLVHKSDKDQMLHLDYTAVIPILVEAIKQQQTRIDALAAKLTAAS